ncbi:MAG: putative NAD-glutamate dehydrogenase, partial [Francisellaceae bacterium]|nr:putative NAD-glutamate dehydrogenase [Francisellaceae bacterium]
MANPADETRVALIDRVVSYVLKKMPANELPLLKSFVTEYYRTVAPEELMSRSILDLYGAVMSFWEHINNKQKDEIKVNVYNPKLELHGWESGHTIIEIITDDIPFLMDSIRIELNKMDIHIHLSICSPGIKLKRDKQNKVMAIIEKDKIEPDVSIETAIYLEIDKQTDLVQLNYIKENLEKSLKDVVDSQKAIEAIESRLREDISDIENLTIISEIDKKENIDFLNWILNKHFVFMNFNKYLITTQFENNHYKLIEDEQLGVAHLANKVEYDFQLLSLDVQQLMHSNKVIILGKTDIKSTIHRAEYLDVIIVKKFNHNHELIAEHRYLGLFSANVYTNNPKIIPIIRLITRSILNNLAFSPKGCEYKILSNIIENLPRIDLFQITDTALLELCMGILNLQERPKIRLFAFKDNLGKFISCVVFVPRETYSSELGHKMQAVLLQGFLGHEIDFTTRFTESSLAQIHYVVKVESSLIAHNIKVIEQRLIEVARTWKDDLKDASLKHAGEEKGNFLLKIFSEAFPTSYQEDFSANMAVLDIDNIEGLTQSKPLGFSLYKPPEESNGIFRFKLFRKGKTIPLSDVLPMLENMGLRVISERPYPILPKGNGTVWINEYRVVYLKDLNLNVELIKDLFQDAFDNIWNNQAENDGFNRLVLEAKLTWREISLIRAFAKYLWQTGFIFAQNTIEDTFVNNPNIALKLIELFKLKFDPINQKNQSRLIDFKKQIIIALDAVSNLNEDKILRRFLDVIEACIRTNYFQKDENNQFKPYIALKFQSNLVPELPLPHPHVEIFVYSPKMEGIHLRGSKVARGGIRWSDRKDDYRTEILGLMKAQQVKNAVIVPLGAKGGFIVKTPLDNYDRESINNIVIEGYKTLISGLLDLTDNLTDNQIVSPSQLVCYDDNDPYLVVAADKGTASFSDIANNLSEKYHFWLKDAFASGGSSGYDHKKMGITAKGAWESVKRHFLELGIDTQNNDFTVVGIGDMSGDVFGNGMILSPHIKLLAAFNHLHIFLDPNPDP